MQLLTRLRALRREPPPLPWRRPRFELALLALVAVAALTPLYPMNPQDVSRLCLSRALLEGKLHNDDCLGTTFAVDRAFYGGHFYSDKAPGMSVLEAPAVAATELPNVDLWLLEDRRLWVARAFSSGLAFLLCVFLVGRVSEGLAPGFGGIVAVAFGLGTLAMPFAVANFAHVTAAALALGAFLLAWARRPFLAGIVAGVAVLTTYESALVGAVLAVYVTLGGARALLRYAAGTLPGLALLGVYNWIAFDAPWRLSYRYVSEEFAEQQAAGFFGIHPPRWDGLREVLVGSGGLLVLSPVLAAAAAGLVLLARRYRAEAVVCAVVTIMFVLVTAGYFDPYGGLSPGPRFLIPALPFLALGLGPAFARWGAVVAVLTAASLAATAVVTLTWASDMAYRDGVWGELARLVRGSNAIRENLAASILSELGVGRAAAAGVLAAAVGAAFVLGLATASVSRGGLRPRAPLPAGPRRERTPAQAPEPRS